jgi:hypothetical protein
MSSAPYMDNAHIRKNWLLSDIKIMTENEKEGGNREI